MGRLESMDVELLDFLCASLEHRCAVVRIKAPWAAALRRLRMRGLVSFHGYLPSPSAQSEWRARQEAKTKTEDRGDNDPDPAGPASPAPVGGGGAADARRAGDKPDAAAAPPKPKRRKFRSMAEKAQRWDETHSPKSETPARPATPALEGGRARNPNEARPLLSEGNTQGASGKARKAPGAAGSPAASRISDRAPSPEPSPAKHAPAGAHHRRRDPTKPPPGYQSRPGVVDLTDAVIKTSQAKGSPQRQRLLAEAAARNAAGLSSGDKSVSVHVRLAQRSLAEQDERAARESCPIEQAKTILRKRFAPVCDAEIVGGKKGMFVVGRRTLSKAEFLAEAERLAS